MAVVRGTTRSPVPCGGTRLSACLTLVVCVPSLPEIPVKHSCLKTHRKLLILLKCRMDSAKGKAA